MALCGVLLVAVVASLRPAAAFYVALGPLLVGSLILSRFDLWPALLATASLVLLVRGRHLSGWALLGAAVAAKLWPLVLVPLALVWSIRRGRPFAPFAGRGGAARRHAAVCASSRPVGSGTASAARRRVRCRWRAWAQRS